MPLPSHFTSTPSDLPHAVLFFVDSRALIDLRLLILRRIKSIPNIPVPVVKLGQFVYLLVVTYSADSHDPMVLDGGHIRKSVGSLKIHLLQVSVPDSYHCLLLIFLVNAYLGG